MEKNKYHCENFRDLLQTLPLYKKAIINPEFSRNPLRMEGFGFPFECDCQLLPQTHLLRFHPSTVVQMERHATSINTYGEKFREIFSKTTENENFTQFFIEKVEGECQSCKQRKSAFMIEFSATVDKDESIIFQAKKIGQTPAFSIKPDVFIKKVLGKESQDLYKKALMNLSSNFGIGAFAYFRRIVETELLHLLQEVSKLDTPESAEITLLLDKHKGEHILSELIDQVFKFLPDSLKGLGDNPFKLLYGTLSVGIHQYSEEECFDKATSLKFLLDFVLKKIYEEKSEVSAVRNHIKNLK